MPVLWLLASEHESGQIKGTLDQIAFRVHMSRGEFAEALSPLVESGFFDASETLADCKQVATPERESEGESDRDSVANATGADAPPDPAIPEREYFLRGREVLGKGAGGLIGKLLKAKGGNVALARAAIEQASQKQAPAEYIAAICRGPPTPRATTVHQAKHAEGRAILDDIGEFISRSGGEANSGVLRHDTSDGPESLRGGTGGNLVELSATRVGKSG